MASTAANWNDLTVLAAARAELAADTGSETMTPRVSVPRPRRSLSLGGPAAAPPATLPHTHTNTDILLAALAAPVVPARPQPQPQPPRPLPPVPLGRRRTATAASVSEAVSQQAPILAAGAAARTAAARTAAVSRARVRPRTREECAVLIQAVYRRHAVLQAARPELHRSRIAHEICDTEQTYVSSLADLVRVFVSPLRQALERGRPIIAADDLGVLFAHFEPVIRFNSRLLAALRERVAHWHRGACIADLFCALDVPAMIALYADYTTSCSTVLDRFSQLRKDNTRFNAFVSTCEKTFWDNAHTGNSFQSFLILPIQRPPRYLLLLKELRNIDEALEHIERLCYQLNEKQRTCEQETERVAALHRVAQRLDPQLKDLAASPTRQFKTELDVRLVNSRRGIVQERHMFVFTDTVILAKRNKLHSDHYHLKEQFALLPPCDLVDITAPYAIAGRVVAGAPVLEVRTRTAVFPLLFSDAKQRAEVHELLAHCQAYLELLSTPFD